MNSDRTPPKKARFEDYLKQVEETVKALESGKLGLEESLERFQAGKIALDECYRILQEAEKKIQILVKDKDGTLNAAAYEAPNAETRSARRKAESL